MRWRKRTEEMVLLILYYTHEGIDAPVVIIFSALRLLVR